MKLCCISDTHGKHNKLDLSLYHADILIHAGDFTAHESETAILLFLEWFNEQPFKHKILIAGNHETQIEDNPKWFNRIIKKFDNIIYLENESITIEDINFYGSPYSNEFYNWAFMEEEPELEKIWNKIPDNTDVLITHGPAYRTNDKVLFAFGRDEHVGSKSLAEKKENLQNLKIHVSGHIHESYGIDYKDDIMNICPCILNERYQLVNEPILIEISKEKKDDK